MLCPASDPDHILKKTAVTSLQGIKKLQPKVESLHVVLLCKRPISISLPKRLTHWTFMIHLQQQLWPDEFSH